MEVLVVTGILALLGGIIIPTFMEYQIRSDLMNAADQVTQALNRARLLSVSAEEDSAWGFHVASATLFKGEEYAARDAESDEFYQLTDTIGLSGLPEVSFSKLEGTPSQTGSIILTSLRGDVRQVDIEINLQGIAINQDDKLTICHCTASPPRTLKVPEAAWPGHKSHGDGIGACATPPQCN